MKQRNFNQLLPVTILMLISLATHAQAPGFQYQAVARDNNGEPLSNTTMEVIAGILEGQEDGPLVWEETHQVTTNGHGLFSLALCSPETTPTGGTAATPGEINWGSNPHFIHITLIEGNTEHDMGTHPIRAVPYALHALSGSGTDSDSDPQNEIQTLTLTGNTLTLSDGGSVELPPDEVNDADSDPENELQDLQISGGSVSLSGDPTPVSIDIPSIVTNTAGWSRYSDTVTYAKNVGIGTNQPNQSMLAIQGDNPDPAQALFEVRRQDGQPVFSVYNEGVWVYVDDNAKGAKGGFAVGGYNLNKKGPGQEYIRVTPDSTRVYFDEQTKGVKGGFAVGGYQSNKGTSQLMSLDPRNYLIGHSAGVNLTGSYNQFMGFESGMAATSSNNNVYLGYQAGKFNATGDYNVFLGYRAGMNGEDGFRNVMIGYNAGLNSAGSGSVYIGDNAGGDATGGWANVFIGQESGFNNHAYGGTSGARNVFVGREAGYSNTIGGDNTYIGTFAGADNEEGNDNVIIGTVAASKGTAGSYNVYVGYRAGYTNEGIYNLVLGHNAGSAESNYTIESDYSSSVFLGARAGYSATTGSDNTFVGYRAGYNTTTGQGNVFLGHRAGEDETGNNKLYIDNSSGTSQDALIYGDFNHPGVQLNGNVAVNYTGFYSGYGLIVDTPDDQAETYALWVAGDSYTTGQWLGSDQALKTNIRPVTGALSKISTLNGIRFDWDQSKGASRSATQSSIGVTAQELEKVFPELVREGPEGFKAVNYNGLIPVLIEAVKEQEQRNQSLQEQLAEQQNLIEKLSRRLEQLENQ